MPFSVAGKSALGRISVRLAVNCSVDQWLDIDTCRNNVFRWVRPHVSFVSASKSRRLFSGVKQIYPRTYIHSMRSCRCCTFVYGEGGRPCRASRGSTAVLEASEPITISAPITLPWASRQKHRPRRSGLRQFGASTCDLCLGFLTQVWL